MSFRNKSTLESQKLQLQNKIRYILSTYASSLTEDENSVISRAMDYVVKSHASIDEQYLRVTEYILAIKGIEYRVNKSATNSINKTSLSFTNDIPF